MKFTDRPKQSGGSHEGPTLYLRLKDGEAVNIIPRGEIYEFYSVFGQRGEATSSTPGAKLRFKVNVVVNEGGTLKAKILEFGQTIYDQMSEINKVCDVTKTKIRLSRKCSGKSDTTYMLLPVINEPLGPKVLETLDRLSLNILGAKAAQPKMPASGADDFGDPPPGPDDLDEIPF